MTGPPHRYFAYGSNLCAQQMARRCPDARDPYPALLADHDWLINQRGVATVAPHAGRAVHGVVWRLSDADLAALDRAESVPAHYRRDRLPVHTDAGVVEAWVYLDHRVNPGPPRPGYLERILDGARQHGLPSDWVAFLHGWGTPGSAGFAGPHRAEGSVSARSGSPAAPVAIVTDARSDGRGSGRRRG